MSDKDRGFEIARRRIGPDEPAFVVAEIGQAHDGSLGTAHAYIDALADAGVDAVKFQTHIAKAESTLDESFRVPFSYEDETRFDYWRRMEFTLEQWAGLAAHATKRDVIFLSSAFSLAGVELLEKVGMPAWKVGSGETWSVDLLEAMVATGKPVLVSTGMSTYEDIDSAVTRCREGGVGVAVLQCTSNYPSALEDVGLNVLAKLHQRFDCPVGLSDHSGSLWPSVAAISLGASIIEVHATFNRSGFGPDTSSSLTIDEVGQLIEARNAISVMRRHPVDKDAMAEALTGTKKMFSKSIAPIEDLAPGTVLTSNVLTTKKPGTGISPDDVERVIGRILVRPVSSDRLLRWEDLND